MAEPATQAPATDDYIRFDHPNVGYVIDGVEDATVRYGFDRDLQTGDRIKLLTPEGTVFAYAVVEDVWTTELSKAYFDMTATDGRCHPASGTMDLLGRLGRHYESESIHLDDEVTVVYFDVYQVGRLEDDAGHSTE